jgi:hypothetical protein
LITVSWKPKSQHSVLENFWKIFVLWKHKS